MRIGVYGAALGSMQKTKDLEVIANNIANVASPGFKRDSIHFSNFMNQTTYTEMEQGKVHSTDNPLDIALLGDGFLKVDADGETLYTRAGNLALNQDKVLVTQEGWPVLGKSGPIQLNGSDFRVGSDGQVFDGDESVDTLDLVQFVPETQPLKLKNGYFRAEQGEAELIPSEGCTVQQGALEESNFNIVEEMARMIESTRIFEAYQKTLQIFDQQESQVIRALGTL